MKVKLTGDRRPFAIPNKVIVPKWIINETREHLYECGYSSNRIYRRNIKDDRTEYRYNGGKEGIAMWYGFFATPVYQNRTQEGFNAMLKVYLK